MCDILFSEKNGVQLAIVLANKTDSLIPKGNVVRSK